MAVEALAWPGPPTLTDAVDGTQSYNMGVAFTVSTSQQCDGVQWRVPDTLAPPSVGAYAIILYDDAANTRLAYKEFTPVAGGYQNVLFDSVVTLPAGTYVATVYTLHYVFRSGSPSGVSTPSGSATAVEGRLLTYNGGAASAPMPTGAINSTYYVSPLIDTGTASGSTPSGIAVPLALGTPTTGLIGASPSGIAIPAAVGMPAVSGPAYSALQQGSWWELETMLDTTRTQMRWWNTRQPVACPNDGEPLRRSVDGILFCPFDNWRPDGQQAVPRRRAVNRDWGHLSGIRQAAARDAVFNQLVLSCPNDGEPLSIGKHGEQFCRYDGWMPDPVN